MTKKKQTNNIHWVCSDCGLEASKGKTFTGTSTWHEAVCEVCGKDKAVTEARDFGHPDFSKIIKKRSDKQTLNILKEKIQTGDFDSSELTGADLILGFERREASLSEFKTHFDNLKKAIEFFSLSKFPTTIDENDPNISVILDIQREMDNPDSIIAEELLLPLINQ